jgi:hypothetical protein
MKKYFFSFFFCTLLVMGTAHATNPGEKTPLVNPASGDEPRSQHMADGSDGGVGNDGTPVCGEKCDKACCFCCCYPCKDCPKNCKECPANCKEGCKFNANACHDANCVDCCKSTDNRECCKNKCCDSSHGCANCAVNVGGKAAEVCCACCAAGC